jgi:hypothetical protein
MTRLSGVPSGLVVAKLPSQPSSLVVYQRLEARVLLADANLDLLEAATTTILDLNG